MPIIPEDSSVSFKKSAKTFFIIIFIVLMLLIAYKTAYLLIQSGGAQKFIGLFVDNTIQGFVKSNSNTGLTTISSIWKNQCSVQN